MAFRYKYKPTDDADLDITSFMNLMIVLVPVLLMSMTFTQVSVHEIELPPLTGGAAASGDSQGKLEVEVGDSGFTVYYPNRDTVVKEIPTVDTDDDSEGYDFEALSGVMQALKEEEELSERRDIVLLLEQDLDYQNLVSTMDAVKSYRTVVAANLVEVELFPEISLGDAS